MRECDSCGYEYKGNSLCCPRCGSTNTSNLDEYDYDQEEDNELDDNSSDDD